MIDGNVSKDSSEELQLFSAELLVPVFLIGENLISLKNVFLLVNQKFIDESQNDWVSVDVNWKLRLDSSDEIVSDQLRSIDDIWRELSETFLELWIDKLRWSWSNDDFSQKILLVLTIQHISDYALNLCFVLYVRQVIGEAQDVRFVQNSQDL